MKTVVKIARKTHVFDASGKSLGRMASEIAVLLRGKHKVDFAPYLDLGDKVVVKNASKLLFSPSKLRSKIYHKHTGYMGHLKEINLGEFFSRNPRKVVELAVKRMLPDNKLRNSMMKRLKIHG